MHHPATRRDNEPASEAFSVSHLVHTLRRYLPAITVSFLAVMVAYTLIALALYVSSPAQTTSSLGFRLEFSGAGDGNYPNGTRFSPSDITNTPILAKVYEQNDLERFITFDSFKTSIFILEANRAREVLRRQYEAKLADPKLTPLDRDRLEREFDTKSKSLSHSDYSINFVQQRRLSRVPATTINKYLHDILATFAAQAMKDRGGLDYRVPVVTRAIFADVEPARAENLLIATDMLRTKIVTAIATVDTLLTAPGAEVLRTEKERLSLPEIRGLFEDILRFRVQPLTRQLLASSVDDRPTVAAFLKSQVEYNTLRAEDARRKLQALSDALAQYQGRNNGTGSMGTETVTGRPAETPAGETVTPQLTESFIDRVVALATQPADLQYRQTAIQRIVRESMSLVPYETEAEYYKTVEATHSSASGGGLTREAARAQLAAAHAAALRAVDQLVEIHRLLSKNLNPGNVMYTITSGPSQRKERTVSLMQLAAYGVLVGAVALPLIIAACLIHNRVREEDAATDVETAARA